MNIIFTVCNRSSLANALALAASVTQHPGLVFYLCWVDTDPVPKLPEQIRFIPISDLNLPEWNQMTSSYYDFELLPACRPWFARHLLDLHRDINTIAFFAPTVYFYQPLQKILDLTAGMLLTPHISSPLAKSSILDDKRILNIGMFHAGAWILNRNNETLAFLDWWKIRTIDRAKFDLCNGMCLDQLWLNFALVRIVDAVQIPDKSWHYGLHSVLNKKLTFKNGQYTVDESPLISIDFAGLEQFDPIWTDYAGLINQNEAFKKIHSEYRKTMSSFKPLLPSDSKPGYGIIPEIKKNRLARKSLVQKLRSVTSFIDQFNIQ